ncbi:MAG: hypothetical protein JST69_13930 [Bacteroidetes bacterium]|nr:hypothetical protein [Bacteroidota bacterium]
MRKLFVVILGLTILISCSKEKKAIEVCQKSKVEFDNPFFNTFQGLTAGTNATWLDFANARAKESVNDKMSWGAQPTGEKDIYLVAFVNKESWGYRWEVDVEQQIVKFINQNEYLSRKYGLSRFDRDLNFEITRLFMDTLKTINEWGEQKIAYYHKARVVNKTGKTLTEAKISGTLQVIFKDKTIEGRSEWESGFTYDVSKSRPWKPDTEKDFYIKTKGIEIIYLSYTPEYVFFQINLKAEDPIGFSYDKNIAEYDLVNRWKYIQK